MRKHYSVSAQYGGHKNEETLMSFKCGLEEITEIATIAFNYHCVFNDRLFSAISVVESNTLKEIILLEK